MLLFALVSVAFGDGLRAADAGPLPYDIVVQVAYGQPRGSERLREEIELGLTEAIGAARCFRSARRFSASQPESGDLLLLLTLDRLSRQLDHELSIAARTSRVAPEDAQRRVIARIEARVTIRVSTVENGAIVRSKSFQRSLSHRPLLGEDARREVARQFVQSVIHSGRSFACKGSSKKWAKQIENVESSGATR